MEVPVDQPPVRGKVRIGVEAPDSVVGRVLAEVLVVPPLVRDKDRVGVVALALAVVRVVSPPVRDKIKAG